MYEYEARLDSATDRHSVIRYYNKLAREGWSLVATHPVQGAGIWSLWKRYTPEDLEIGMEESNGTQGLRTELSQG